MTIESNERTYIGFSNLVLTRLDDDVVLAFPKPQDCTVDPAYQQRETQKKNEQGRTVRGRVHVVGEMPTMQIVYNYLNAELISFRVGNRLATGSFNKVYPKTVLINKGLFPGATENYVGHGLPSNVLARASITRNGLTFPLMRMPFEDYATWRITDDRFAVGANGAMAFSDNLVAAKEVAVMTIPFASPGRKLSDILIGAHRVDMMMVDSDGKVGFLEVYSASPNRADAAIQFSAESLTLSLFIDFPPGSCRAWNIIDTDERVACA